MNIVFPKSIKTNDLISFKIFNYQGIEFDSKVEMIDNDLFTLDISSLKAGIYLIKINDKILKFVKM